MSVEKPQDYLLRAVNTHIRLFDQKRQKNKFIALFIKLFSASLAGAITVLLGIKMPSGGVSVLFSNVALVLSAMIAVLSAWDSFFNHRALWIKFTFATNAMRDVKQELEYLIVMNGDTLSTEQCDQIQQRIRSILSQNDRGWEELRKEDSAAPLQSSGPKSIGVGANPVQH